MNKLGIVDAVMFYICLIFGIIAGIKGYINVQVVLLFWATIMRIDMWHEFDDKDE